MTVYITNCGREARIWDEELQCPWATTYHYVLTDTFFTLVISLSIPSTLISTLLQLLSETQVPFAQDLP